MDARSIRILEKTKLFQNCTADEIEELLYLFTSHEEHYRKGSYILHSGDVTGLIGIILSGRALIIQEDWWGNRNIMQEIGPGAVFGESFACVKGSTLTVSVTADTDTEAVWLKVESVLSATGHRAQAKVLRNFISDLAMKNLRFSEKIRHLGGRSTRAKLLSYLSAEAERNHSNSFSIPFSRQELADYLFVERSGLSNELSKMQKEGLITTEKNHFELLK